MHRKFPDCRTVKLISHLLVPAPCRWARMGALMARWTNHAMLQISRWEDASGKARSGLYFKAPF
eukprot:4496122-Pyramimonas_sp.AAC.2